MILILLFVLLLYLTLVEHFQSIDHFEVNHQKVAIVSMMRKPKNIEYWLDYHIKKGVSKFYLRIEDTREILPALKTYPQVHLQEGSSKDASKITEGHESAGEAQMRRQRDWVTEAIKMANMDNIAWLIHIDSDELVDCNGDIASNISAEVASINHTLVMQNYEAKYDKIKGDNDSCFEYKELIKCDEGKCTSYANGKGIGRVSDKLREFGVHRFRCEGESQELTLKNVRLLHFESCDFNQYVEKYLQLAKKESKQFPFQFYNESIKVARSEECKENNEKCLQKFKDVYRRFKVNPSSRTS